VSESDRFSGERCGWEVKVHGGARSGGSGTGSRGVPEGDPLHRAVTTRTGGAVGKLGVGFVGGLEVGLEWCGSLPGLTFGVAQEGCLFEEGSDAVEVLATGGMKPAKEADAMEAGG